jgi:hypothetical protein
MKSDFLLAHLWLARSLLEMGRFDAALAVDIDRGSPGAWLGGRIIRATWAGSREFGR